MSAPNIINPATAGGLPPAGVYGTGIPGTIAFFTGATTIGDSAITDDGTTVSFVGRNLSSTAAQTWTLASSTSALNIASGLLNLDTTNTRVGIGTTAPGAKLQVNAAASSSAIFAVGSSGAGTSYGITIQAGTNSSDRSFGVYDATFTLPYLNVRGDGNVGIGTASPGNLLTVSKGNASGFNLQYDSSGNARTGLFLATRGSSSAIIGGGSEWADATTTARSTAATAILQNAGAIQFFTDTGLTSGNTFTPTERARIDSLGRFLIGTSTAGIGGNNATAFTLTNGTATVYQSIRASGTEELYLYAAAGSVGLYSYTNTPVVFGANNAERMRLTATGNIYGTSGATGMTDGFFYIPAAAGTPTGTPTAISGRVPMYYDTTNNKFYVYNGAWKAVTLA